jgi:hypothetical protein
LQVVTRSCVTLFARVLPSVAGYLQEDYLPGVSQGIIYKRIVPRVLKIILKVLGVSQGYLQGVAQVFAGCCQEVLQGVTRMQNCYRVFTRVLQ